MSDEMATIRDAQRQPLPLRLSRVFHASPQTVFAAWGSAEHVKAWFAPSPYSAPDARVEMREGGAFEVCMRSPEGEEHWTRGTFVEVIADTRLVIDMQAVDAAGRPLFRAYTEIGFSESLGGTLMEVVQTYTLLDPTAAALMVAGAPEGWGVALEQLETEVMCMRGGTETGVRSVVHASFRLERTYEAPIGRLWLALTDQAAKSKWFGGPSDRWELIEREMDVRPGGRERVRGRWEGGVVSSFDAIYHDVILNDRLIYSYEMHLDEKKISVSLATMQLKMQGAGTTLVVTEQGAFLDGYDDADSREHGTGFLLDAIGASLND